MSMVKMTVRQCKDLGLWDKYCEWSNTNSYAINEGLIDYDYIIYFDSEFKKERTNVVKYNFGDIIQIDYGNNEVYKAVVFKNKIGYEDGKQDLLETILEQEASEICEIEKIN